MDDRHNQTHLQTATAYADEFRNTPRNQIAYLKEKYAAADQWWNALLPDQQTPQIHLRVKFCRILLLYYQGDFMVMFTESHQLLKGVEHSEDILYIGHIYRLMAHVCYVFSLVDPSIAYAFKALRRFETIHAEEDIIKTLIILGIVYSLVDDFDLQEKYFLEALERAKKKEAVPLIRSVLSNISYLYVLSEKVESAHATLAQAMALDSNDGSITNVGIEINLLRLALIDEDYDQAFNQIEKLEHLEALKADQSLVMDFYLLKSEFCHRKYGPSNACQESLEQGLKTALAIDSKKYLETYYQRLATSYFEKNDFAEAFNYQSKAIHIRDAMEREKSHNQYVVLRLQYEVEHIHMEVEALKDQTKLLSQELQTTRYALRDTQLATIYALASLAEFRDQVTGKHILRMVKYVELFCQILKKNLSYATVLTEGFIDDLSKSSSLHDIGKVGISDLILNKPAKLTLEEFENIKNHTRIGRDALSIAETILGDKSFLSLAKSIAYYHHEKWDGSGYPQGLIGEAIPLEARIVAILDVYDALITQRPYKRAFTHQEAMHIIEQGEGSHFDPHLSRVFIDNHLEFSAIANDYGDTDEHI